MLVYKFLLTHRLGDTKIEVPYRIYKALMVTLDQNETPCLYAVVDLDEKRHDSIVVRGHWTGEIIPENFSYLSTVLIEGLYYHYFWRREE
jgi:hypothetical protein